MKLKIKLTTKKIFRLAYIIILLANFLVIFFLYSLINEYVYGAFIINKSSGDTRLNISGGSINIDQFNKVIEKIDKKSKKNNIVGINNIFD